MKKILAIFFALSILTCCLCGCGSSKLNGGSVTESKTETAESKVRTEVERRLRLEFLGGTIGGKELKSSSGRITNIEEKSSKEYLVNGTIIMTDVYGTEWNNMFDCIVKTYDDGETWDIYSFDYVNDRWSKS